MTRPSDEGRCDICGEPMPEGESMFRIHGYSGPCPKPPLPQPEPINWQERAERAERIAGECQAGYQTLERELAEARALLREAKTAIIESLTMCRDLSKSLPRRADVDLVMVARTLAKIEHACARIDALLKDKP